MSGFDCKQFLKEEEHSIQPILQMNEVLELENRFLKHKEAQLRKKQKFNKHIFLKVPKRRKTFRMMINLKKQPTEQKIKKINSRKDRYKRSTNNSYKKFTSVAKRLYFRQLNDQQKLKFEDKFKDFNNSRTYYFIVLAHVKILFNQQKIDEFMKNFKEIMTNKIDIYLKEINRTDNRNFINFRFDQISDIQFAFTAFDLYFKDMIEEAIEIIYKKQRAIVLKRPQLDFSIQTIKNLEKKLKQQKSEMTSKNKIYQLKIQEKQELNQKYFTVPNFNHNSKNKNKQMQEFRRGLSKTQQNIYQRKITTKSTNKQSNNKLPLKHLQNSFPYYSYFFSILYSFPVNDQIQIANPFQFINFKNNNKQIASISKQANIYSGSQQAQMKWDHLNFNFQNINLLKQGKQIFLQQKHMLQKTDIEEKIKRINGAF